jgi:hypothetical protein
VTEANVKLALTTAVLSALGATPVARENVPFTKPNNAKWARLSYLPNIASVETLGDLGEDMNDGIIQVDFYYPAGSGDAAATADVETFRSTFKAGHKVVASGQSAVIRKCGRHPGRLEDNWFIVSVDLEWYALIPR